MQLDVPSLSTLSILKVICYSPRTELDKCYKKKKPFQMVILYSAFFPLNRIPDVNFVQTGFLFFFYGQELHILYIELCYTGLPCLVQLLSWLKVSEYRNFWNIERW